MDAILYWNEVALEANRVSHTNGTREQTGPTLSARALAIVHLAMYDAFAAIDPTAGDAYLPNLPAPPGSSSTSGAVAGAAYTTLAALFPSQRRFFERKLADVLGPFDPGYHFGVAVARALLDDRDDDPGAEDTGYVASLARPRHRPDPDNPDQGFHAPYYGARCKGFAVTSRHELAPPPVDNKEYRTALRQVRGLGIRPELMGTLPTGLTPRNVDQTIIGLYWAYDGARCLGTPPRQYNQIVRRVAIARKTTEAKNARLFALVNAAMGDAGILAWDQKYLHDLWRPVVGIRQHDPSMGLATTAKPGVVDDTDPGWLPLGAPSTNAPIGTKNFTPGFPAYPSGHATFGAAALHVTRRFFGTPARHRGADDLFDGLDFVSEELDGANRDNAGTVRPRHVRSFPDGLWDMILENGRSRVFLGVHWVFDAFAVDEHGRPDLDRLVDGRHIGGVPLGLTIADDIFDSGLEPSPVGPRLG